MREIFQKMAEELKAGRDLVLATVTASSGAVPRHAGSHMLAGANGRICGTIGGGAIEYRALQMTGNILKEKKSVEQTFALNRNDRQKLGMACGGEVNILFHWISAEDKRMITLAEHAEQLYREGKDFWMLSDIKNNGKLYLHEKNKAADPQVPAWLTEKLCGRPKRMTGAEEDWYTEQIGNSAKVYIFGGGHVAQELVPVLAHAGFCCVILEDRREFADPKLFPAAEEIRLTDFYDIKKSVQITEEDYVCVMTSGHDYDVSIQAQVLRTQACYIGVMGSKHKRPGVVRCLLDQGFTQEEVDRISSPIGLWIRAETPAEIAISIAAEMIQRRAERRLQI